MKCSDKKRKIMKNKNDQIDVDHMKDAIESIQNPFHDAGANTTGDNIDQIKESIILWGANNPTKREFENKKVRDRVGAKSAKTPFDMVPPAALIEMAKAFGHGAEKYGRQNWAEDLIPFSVYYAAMMRHLIAWYDGENDDPDSQINHLAHLMANAGILLHMIREGNFLDDRLSSIKKRINHYS
jgi:Domain of unknown function (DUF5664)